MKTIVILVATLAAAQSTELERVVNRMDAYLAAYEPQLSVLIADESMLQEIRGAKLRIAGDPTFGEERIRRRREIQSEVAFIALPADGGWLGFRHVKSVDGQRVERGEASLVSALQTPGLDVARDLLNASAAHNLGLRRTTNLPNLPLEFLHPRNRDRFSMRLDGRETVRGVRAARVVFNERAQSTLIKNPANGADMPSVVKAWIDPANGRLLRAEVSALRSAWLKASVQDLRIEFIHDSTVGLLVPSEMREMFQVDDQRSKGTSVARYSNFRRFQTSARIVPQ